MDFIAQYSVDQPLVGWVQARRGDLLTVWPSHPTHTLIVQADRPGFPILDHCFVQPGALYGCILMWEADGIISPLTPFSSLSARLSGLTSHRSVGRLA